VRSLPSKLAPLAQSFDFQRTAQQCELSQAGRTFEKLVHVGYLYVVYPSASDANDVVMRLYVAVIPRSIMQERYLVRLSHFAKLLQNSMDGGQRYVGMPATDGPTYLVGARMVLRSEQGSNDREPLGCNGNATLMTSRNELPESLNGVTLTPPRIQQPKVAHKRTLADYQTLNVTNNPVGGKETTADRLNNLQARPIPALTYARRSKWYSASREIVNLQIRASSLQQCWKLPQSATLPFEMRSGVRAPSLRIRVRHKPRFRVA